MQILLKSTLIWATTQYHDYFIELVKQIYRKLRKTTDGKGKPHRIHELYMEALSCTTLEPAKAELKQRRKKFIHVPTSFENARYDHVFGNNIRSQLKGERCLHSDNQTISLAIQLFCKVFLKTIRLDGQDCTTFRANAMSLMDVGFSPVWQTGLEAFCTQHKWTGHEKNCRIMQSKILTIVKCIREHIFAVQPKK